MTQIERRTRFLVIVFCSLSMVLGACTAVTGSTGQDAFDDLRDLGFDLIVPPIVETDNGTKIHTLTLGPSNVYLIESGDDVVLVDAGLPLVHPLILGYLKSIGMEDNLRLIYITHAHPDHYGSAAALRDTLVARGQTKPQIAVHMDDAAEMEAGTFSLGNIADWDWVSANALPRLKRIASQLEKTAPDIRLTDGQHLNDLGVEGLDIDAQIVHTPGHTPGSSILMLEGTHAFVGDLASNIGEPHAQKSFAHDWDQVADSLRLIQALEPQWVFAGHGAEPMTGKEFQALDPTIFGE